MGPCVSAPLKLPSEVRHTRHVLEITYRLFILVHKKHTDNACNMVPRLAWSVSTYFNFSVWE